MTICSRKKSSRLFAQANCGQLEVLDGLPAAALKLDVEVPKMSAEEEKKEDSSSKFVDCKMGAYLLDHVWDIERLDDIQPLEFLDDFVPVPQFLPWWIS